ncbi:hypothetical protein Pyn_37320 [Prunus yedoensis var. nudiflora]|uniref:Uncharacterized protein n=1 Tax=Prunus yedoensis var. nudiflora TaxID=2094558 RepID=A0A314ZCV3_PRUYE|nr:hypothetical protein Pyn_37320 [Prunus yedoensis var. nudiflora]
MAMETECSTDGTSIIVGENTLLFAALKERMRRSPAIPPLPSTCCIFKVPEVLRRHKPNAYEPDVVSIGPFHRGSDERFQLMETVKQWYLDTLLTRMEISLDEFIVLLHKEGIIVEFEKRARQFYAEPLDHDTESKFTEIMILDGCFVIQLVRKIVDLHARDAGDPIWNMDCMFQYVCHDLLLLENQLPWFVLSRLYDLIRKKLPGEHEPNFRVVLLFAFSEVKSLEQYLKPYRRARHHKVDDENVCHILDLIRTCIVLDFKEESEDEFGLDIPPATALSEAGVKFKKGDSADNLLNIKFENGVLTIPELAIGELTQPLFRNLIAFEQCYHGRSHQITSYAFFMDKLISSDKDIQLLSEEKILANWLNVEDGSKFFNSLYIDTTLKDFQYDKLCAEVNKYYQVKWNKYFEQLRREYFSSPWKIIALTVGILILLVTLSQFLLSVLSSTLFTGIRVHELSADM